MIDFAREDRKMQDHIFRPGVHTDRTHAPNYSKTAKELDREDAAKFEATIQAQLRDLFATV